MICFFQQVPRVANALVGGVMQPVNCLNQLLVIVAQLVFKLVLLRPIDRVPLVD